MPTLARLTASDPSASCRTDFLALSFKFPTPDDENDLFAYFYDLSEKVLPTKEAMSPTKGKYYERHYQHPCGASLEFTSISSHLSTAGTGLLTLTGTQFGSLDATERRDLIVDMRTWPGFYRCTRWDAQITSIDPPITVNQIVDDVEAGRLWVTKFSTSQPWIQRDSNGLIKNQPTQYFGSPQSRVRLRIYDHGAKHGWQAPSLRVEAQLRKELADQHFRRLAGRCYDERHVEPIFVAQEERTVKDALDQHADFRDTSAWEGRPKPRKWAQTAERPAWWDEMLSHKADPLDLQYKVDTELTRAVEVMVEQYGRKLFLFTYREALSKGKSSEQVLHELMISCAGKLKKGDDDLLASLCPPGTKREARRIVKDAENIMARWQEQQVPED